MITILHRGGNWEGGRARGILKRDSELFMCDPLLLQEFHDILSLYLTTLLVKEFDPELLSRSALLSFFVTFATKCCM